MSVSCLRRLERTRDRDAMQWSRPQKMQHPTRDRRVTAKRVLITAPQAASLVAIETPVVFEILEYPADRPLGDHVLPVCVVQNDPEPAAS